VSRVTGRVAWTSSSTRRVVYAPLLPQPRPRPRLFHTNMSSSEAENFDLNGVESDYDSDDFIPTKKTVGRFKQV
jgi:hypothetical protein